MSGRIAIAVVTYNSASMLPTFLEALPDGVAGVDYELVVVDNCSTDGTVELVRRLAPTATVIPGSENRGYSAGINRAVAAVAGSPPDAVLIANADIRLEHGCVAGLLDALKSSGAGIVVPRLVDEQGRLQYSLRHDATIPRVLAEALIGGTRARRFPALSQVVGDVDAYESAHDVEWASGALMLVAYDCLVQTGRWDETFFLYCEEEEFQQRARSRGFRVHYVPDVRAVHLGGEMHELSQLWALGSVNKLRLYARTHGPFASALFRGALVSNELLRIKDSAHRRALRALVSRDALTPGVRP
jgi:N-acetylglucosaminyl-diphospho-decaprenol L-rhamnosyltransferase